MDLIKPIEVNSSWGKESLSCKIPSDLSFHFFLFFYIIKMNCTSWTKYKRVSELVFVSHLVILFWHASKTCYLVNILILFLVFFCGHFDHSSSTNKVYSSYGQVYSVTR